MLTIGLYDSGIGGLTTLAKLISTFGGYNYYYFADNENMPFGNKDEKSLKKIIQKNIEKLKLNSDIQIIACNTASTMIKSNDVFKLKPHFENYNPPQTLLLATKNTIKQTNTIKNGYLTANTNQLATLIEIVASLSYKKQVFDFSILTKYLQTKLANYNDVSNILVGCSHYVFVKDIIASIANKNTILDDGNDYLIDDLKPYLKYKQNTPKITYNFSGTNEQNEYVWLTNCLTKNIY